MFIINSIFSNIALCDFGGPTYLLFSSNVAPLVHYSHIPITIISLILGFFILFNNHKGLANRTLFCLTIAFSSWVFLDSIFWASNRSDVIMFVWSLQILFEPIVYISALYLINVLIKKEDISFNKKVLISLIYLPVVIFVPTKYSLSGFDLNTCLSMEGPIALYYTYGIEILYTLWIVYFSVREFIKTKTNEVRQQIVLLTTGIILLLLSFSSGNIISSFTEDWRYAQIGLLTMPLFIGFLVYSIVKYKTFNIKLIGTQALVVALWVALGATLFVNTLEYVRIIISLTLILFLIIGIVLVRSVKREIEQREKIEKLAKDLEGANEKLKELDQLKSEFLSLATHQIRAPLTAIKGYSSMLLEGDFGDLPQKAKDSVETIMKSCQNLINIVGDFLNISRIEQGKMVYEKSVFDVGELVKEVINEIKPNIDKTGLSFDTDIPAEEIKIKADRSKIKQVVGNIIDNAMKYTPKGNIFVSVYKDDNKVKIEIKDNGVGIDPSEIDKLFNKFSRAKDANKINVTGTGLGLYIAKKMAEAHNGDIKVSSEGIGKGTIFTIELPLK